MKIFRYDSSAVLTSTQPSLLLNDVFFQDQYPHVAGLALGSDTGVFTPGGYDDTFLDALPIDWWPLRADRPRMHDWHVRNVTIKANGTTVATGAEVIIDTTLDAIYAPERAVRNFYAVFSEAKQAPRSSADGDIWYEVPCDKPLALAASKDPSTYWSIKGDEYVLPALYTCPFH